MTAVALACVLGLQGNTSESLEWEQRALAAAEQLGFPFGPFSSAFILTYLAWLRMITGDAAGAREFGRRTLDIAEQCRFDYFSVIARQYVLVPEPDLPGDADELERCEAGMDLIGHGAFRPGLPRHRGSEPFLWRESGRCTRAGGRRAPRGPEVGRMGSPTGPAAPAGRRSSRPPTRSGWMRWSPI